MDKELDAAIREFQPAENNWLPLEEHISKAYASNDFPSYYDAIFNLFERFPEDDGNGVFWSAVHGMEATGGYEEKLLMYFRRHPTVMTKTMLTRIRNSGEEKIGGIVIDRLIT